MLIFSGNFAVSLERIRDYLQIEARVHAQDTATSLGLSLSPHFENPDDPILETMIKAIYDMGYYKEIKLTDADGKVLVRLQDHQIFEQVPDWFIRWLPMETAVGMSEINHGWNLAGTISVTISPGYAYLALYQQTLNTLYYSLAALLISVVLLFFVLRLTLKPLRVIDRFAQHIAEGRFTRIDPLPWTREVRNVAKSMNLMAERIEGAIGNLHRKLETSSERLLLDQTTGLHKKNRFETDMKQLFLTGGSGYVVVLRLHRLAQLSLELEDAVLERFLRQFADVLTRRIGKTHPQARAYRFYGGEFALLMKGLHSDEADSFARHLQQDLNALSEQYQQNDIVHFGLAPWSPFSSTEGIVNAAIDACEQARLVGSNSYVLRNDSEGRTIDDWKVLTTKLIDDQDFSISYIGQVHHFKTGTLLMEEASTQVYDDLQQQIPIGVFVAMAEKFGKIVALDTGVTRKVVDHLEQGRYTHGVIINLSMSTLKDPDFRVWMIDFLGQHQHIASQLIFSVTAYTAAKNLDLFRNFIDFVHRVGARILLKRYETQFISVETVKSLKLDYIRLARELTVGIGEDAGKRAFVEALREVGTLLGIVVIAEQVPVVSDLDVVKEIGLLGSSV
jgi:EAL domain-containing protein (putative c-di-GMP-specific phosphodiesterase class I)/GGDEF domain-containing protein